MKRRHFLKVISAALTTTTFKVKAGFAQMLPFSFWTTTAALSAELQVTKVMMRSLARSLAATSVRTTHLMMITAAKVPSHLIEMQTTKAIMAVATRSTTATNCKTTTIIMRVAAKS